MSAHGASPALLAARVLDALPQTQCTRCGYADCAAYAHAIAEQQAPINRCPPAGQAGVERLALLTGQAAQPLDPACGQEGPRAVAWIDEDWCIGCTLCIKVCPTDAIIGANKRMHTVLEAYCTGCGLCLPACPVDCIRMESVSGEATGWAAWSAVQAEQARQRYQARQQRLQCEQQEHAQALQAKAQTKLAHLEEHSQHTDPVVLDQKRAVIAAALERARAQRGHGR
ncbi:MAG: RnfABCDGE type electron transport complex subunit B [Rhodoferax sp.]